jgi:predicted hydrocarbon binding protein
MEFKPKTVKNSLINALLTAIFDEIDSDGRNSILEHANLGYMNIRENLPPNGFTPLEDFLKLVDSMNYLLIFSKSIMFEIGRKFAFYISPFGTEIGDLIEKIKTKLIDLQIKLEYDTDDKINVTVIECPFCRTIQKLNTAIVSRNFTCEFFRGFLHETVKKSAHTDVSVKVEHSDQKNDVCKFIINIIKINASENKIQTLEEKSSLKLFK